MENRIYSYATKSGLCDIEVKQITPTYLRALGVGDAILVHKKSKFPHVSNNSLEIMEHELFTCGKPYECEDLNLTGAPLECSFGFDDSVSNNCVSLMPRHWQKDEMHYIPLSFQQASSLLSELNLDSADNEPLNETVWVVCDGLDGRRIVLMGSHVDSNREWFTRSFVSLRDDVSRKDLQSFAESTVKSHCAFARMTEEEVRYSVTCIYEVFGARNAGNNEHSPRNVDQHGSVILEVTWENNSFRRNVLKPPLEALTTLDLLVTMGQDTSEAYPLWQQLSLLRQLVSAVVSGGDPVMPDGGLSSGDDVSLLDRVKEVAKNLDSAPQQWGVNRDNNLSTDFAETVTNIAAGGRAQVDVTHTLWRLLMRCKNVEDLVNCLRTVYEEVKFGHFVPYIDPQNSSRMASEIKNLRSSDSKLPDLTGITSLEMLLEIGLETLEKDYLHILLASHVATFEQLGYKEDQSFQDRLTWLHRMHSVVEFLLVVQCHLNLPSRSLYPIVVSLIEVCVHKLQHYDDLKRSNTLLFRHAVRTVDVQLHVANKEFVSWRLKVTSKNWTKQATTVVQCSSLPIFPPTLFDTGCNNSQNCSGDIDIESMYSLHCTELKTIANKLG